MKHIMIKEVFKVDGFQIDAYRVNLNQSLKSGKIILSLYKNNSICYTKLNLMACVYTDKEFEKLITDYFKVEKNQAKFISMKISEKILKTLN